MKKIIALLLAAMMLLALAACGEDTPAETKATEAATAATEATAEASTEAAHYTIGICQFLPHPALDAATEGFMDAVKAELGEENVTFDLQDAAGEATNCATIVNGLVASNVDLIMANATPAVAAAYNATETIPILGTSVTEYGVALGIQNFSGTVGGNVSGTSDLADLDQQAQMILDWFPEAQKIALLYCNAEANSQYQVDEVQKKLIAKGVAAANIRQISFSDTSTMAATVNGPVTVPLMETLSPSFFFTMRRPSRMIGRRPSFSTSTSFAWSMVLKDNAGVFN